MPLEVGQVDHEIVVLQMAPHDVVFQVLPVLHRNGEFTLRVHDVHPGNIRKAVVLRRLKVVLRPGALAAVSRIALHNGAFHAVHQILDQLRTQEIMAARFPGADLDGHPSGSRSPHSLVNPYKSLRRNLLRHPYPGNPVLLRGRAQRIFRQRQARQGRGGRLEPRSSRHIISHGNLIVCS